MANASQPQQEAPRSSAPEPNFQDLQDRLGPQLQQAQEQLMEFNERAKDFIRKNPGTTLLGAAAIGFLIGKWASRK
jgi:ElaB/YqjD/DUF883 family membrane-anchored ribosome-binding protein